MKSFFKKLSLVLAAAMVITMLPLQSAKAVTKVNLGVDATKAAAGETIELEVGATQKIGFYGVKDYNTAGAKTKVWKSDNTSVATVTNAFITAVAPGTANISFTCTNNGIDYAGTVKVVVKAAGSVPQTQGNVSAKQTTWQTVEVTFADEAAAKAAKDKIVVERVKTSSKGTFYLNVSAKPTQDKNICKIEPLSNGVTYRITVPGVTKPFEITMNVGAPDFVDISYDTVYMSSETKTDIKGDSLSNPLVTPQVNVYDANGIIVQTEAKGFKYSTDKTQNIGNPVFNTTKGTIRFNKLESSCYVKVVYSYKDANNKTITLEPAETTVSPVTYVAPNLQGFVEKITLVDKTTKAHEIVYPSDYSYKAEIAVDQELALAFYFETPEGTKYAPDLVKTTVIDDDNKNTMLNCKVNGTNYNYYVTKDNPDATNVSFKENSNGTVYIRGWNEGTETICIYQRSVANKQDPVKDKLVGILNIEVQEEAKVVDLGLNESSLNGFTNTLIVDDQKGELTYKLEDQYGKPIKALLDVKATDGKGLNGAVTLPDNGKAEGKIVVDYTLFNEYPNGRELEISVRNQKDEFKDYITVTTDKIDNTNGRLGYALVVKNKDIKNVDLKDDTAAAALKLTIDVARTYDDNKYDLAEAFYFVGDADTTLAKPAIADKLVVIISDEEGNTLSKDIEGTDFELASEMSSVINAGDAFDLDLFNETAGEVNADSLLTGNYTVSLYKTGEAGKEGALELIDAVDISINNAVEKLKSTNVTYVLGKDGDKVKVKTDKSWRDNATSANVGATLVKEIVGEFYTWVDVDSNGKVGVEADEIKQLKTLNGFDVVDSKFVVGADSKKEIFIKYVVVEFKLSASGPVMQQTIEVNRKYTYGNN